MTVGHRSQRDTIGLQKAKEMILTEKHIDATEAKRIGIVARVVSRTELKLEALALAQSIAKNPRIAVLQAKVAKKRLG